MKDIQFHPQAFFLGWDQDLTPLTAAEHREAFDKMIDQWKRDKEAVLRRVPRNPYANDAEAAGKWVRACLKGTHPAYRDMPIDVIARVARWAGHWGELALRQEALARFLDIDSTYLVGDISAVAGWEL